MLIHYGTSGHTVLSLNAPEGGLHSVVFAPKADGVVLVGSQGAMSEWQVNNPHPEITLKTVFGKVWYEGYSEPAYVWQSTGGTDDFEAKFSLTPLIYGTLKGTFYALIFAVPMALLAAVYVSEFMHPTVKAYVKPVVEMMAALPSVVLGFLAGLWLAPMVERVVPGLFLLAPGAAGVRPGGVLRVAHGTSADPGPLQDRHRGVPADPGGDRRGYGWRSPWAASWRRCSWAAATGAGCCPRSGLTYDQRNSLVVGVAMGFAVIPIIFTIAEDSLANVPAAPARRLAGAGRQPLADRDPDRAAHRAVPGSSPRS